MSIAKKPVFDGKLPSTRCTSELEADVAAYAERIGRTEAWVVRRAVEQYFKRVKPHKDIGTENLGDS